MTDKIREGLKLLAEDLYQNGYQCGLGTGDDYDRWLSAFVEAMVQVAAGEPYSDEMVSDIARAKSDKA